jgi:hypothetical protein
MLVSFWLKRQGMEDLPPWVSLLVVAVLLVVSIAASMVAQRKEKTGIRD